jgi:hypothetical protein
MPFLSDEMVADLLERAQFNAPCVECRQATAYDYCRSCDEFYWIHAAGCQRREAKHDGHRLTIVPFVERR